MLPQIASSTSAFFILTSLLSIFIFYKASGNSKRLLGVVLAWMLVQGILSYQGFYLDTSLVPPRFSLMIAPALILISLCFWSSIGKKFIDRFDMKLLLWLHVVRIPIELILYQLYLEESIPELMTFAGVNFDILAGITAPIMYYFVYVKKRIGRKGLLLWNVLSFLLLMNIVINAILSVPSPIQTQAFDQPNIAILHFPVVWLPSIVVVLVMFAHFIAFRRLRSNA